MRRRLDRRQFHLVPRTDGLEQKMVLEVYYPAQLDLPPIPWPHEFVAHIESNHPDIDPIAITEPLTE